MISRLAHKIDIVVDGGVVGSISGFKHEDKHERIIWVERFLLYGNPFALSRKFDVVDNFLVPEGLDSVRASVIYRNCEFIKYALSRYNAIFLGEELVFSYEVKEEVR